MDYPPTRSRDYLSVLNSRNLCKKIKKITSKPFPILLWVTDQSNDDDDGDNHLVNSFHNHQAPPTYRKKPHVYFKNDFQMAWQEMFKQPDGPSLKCLRKNGVVRVGTCLHCYFPCLYIGGRQILQQTCALAMLS